MFDLSIFLSYVINCFAFFFSSYSCCFYMKAWEHIDQAYAEKYEWCLSKKERNKKKKKVAKWKQKLRFCYVARRVNSILVCLKKKYYILLIFDTFGTLNSFQ